MEHTPRIRSATSGSRTRWAPGHDSTAEITDTLATMPTVATTLDIDATPAELWRVITDFPAHDEWDPFMRNARGELREGGRFRFDAKVGKRTLKIDARFKRVDPERELSWGGPGVWLVGKIVRAHHWIRLTPIEGGTRIDHGEEFRGLVPRLLGRRLVNEVQPTYEKVNRALAARVAALR